MSLLIHRAEKKKLSLTLPLIFIGVKMTLGTIYFLLVINLHMDEPKDSLKIKTLKQLMLLGTARGLVHPSVSDMHD